MKSLLYSAIIILGLSACSQPSTDYENFVQTYRPYNNRGAQVNSGTGVTHVVAPGEALRAYPQSRTDAAFDQYANPRQIEQAAHTNAYIGNPYRGNNSIPQPHATNNGGYTTPTVPPLENRLILHPISNSSSQLLQQPSVDENKGPMDYIVKISNGTNGRIFVEAHDANNTIYPCGFMQKGQSFSTPLKNVMPVKGPIVVVVRDPDQPNAPELRRYRVKPPRVSYKSRTLEIKLIAGGRYKASIDGKVYFENDPNL